MIRKTILTVVVVAVAAATASAQSPRVELSGTAGWTFSDGVSGSAVVVPGIGTFDRIDPKDAFSWGARLGFNVTPNVEVGFLFNEQSTKLEAGGTTTLDIADLKVYNYHGYLAYNFGDEDAKARPYILGGLGATRYGNVTLANINGENVQIGGKSKFATTWGAGLKFYPSPKVGAKFQARYTPTNIKDTADEWVCAPYLPVTCAAGGVNHQYASQLEFTAGLFLRF